MNPRDKVSSHICYYNSTKLNIQFSTIHLTSIATHTHLHSAQPTHASQTARPSAIVILNPSMNTAPQLASRPLVNVTHKPLQSSPIPLTISIPFEFERVKYTEPNPIPFNGKRSLTYSPRISTVFQKRSRYPSSPNSVTTPITNIVDKSFSYLQPASPLTCPAPSPIAPMSAPASPTFCSVVSSIPTKISYTSDTIYVNCQLRRKSHDDTDAAQRITSMYKDGSAPGFL